jgi:hypothetical protein
MAASAHAPAARREALTLERSRPFSWLVRAGFLGRALTYGLIGGVALALAVGAGGAPTAPNQQGALALIAGAPLGRVALGVICAGLLAYALWKLGQAVIGRGPEGGGGGSDLWHRVSNLGGSLAYFAFFAVAVHVMSGSSGGGSSAPRQAAAGVLAWPGGREIVGGAGVALLAISAYQAYDGVSGGFAHETKTGRMGAAERGVFLTLGRVGLIARSTVFALVGYFLLRTAVDFHPGDAVGVDGALAQVHREPFGPWLLGLVALGLLTFAVFSLFEARYRRL